MSKAKKSSSFGGVRGGLTPQQQLHNFVMEVKELRRLQAKRKSEKTAMLEHAITMQERKVDEAIATYCIINHIQKPKKVQQPSFNWLAV